MSHIKKFWDSQSHKKGHNASWGDNWCVQLEIDNIEKYIKAGDKVLDVGCSNGYSAIEQAKSKSIDIEGIDFSEPMIEEANKLNSGIHFKVGDIKEIPYDRNTFDVTYTTRVLINLPTWEEQVMGIKECIRVTKPGGTVILSEGFYEPLQKLNALRQICNLEPLVEHDFNRYLKKSKLEKFLEREEWECEDFSSVYYLGSRLLRELVTKIEDYEGYSNPINKWFYELENNFSGGGLGIQQAYIIKI